jgi:hypothetical protein
MGYQKAMVQQDSSGFGFLSKKKRKRGDDDETVETEAETSIELESPLDYGNESDETILDD